MKLCSAIHQFDHINTVSIQSSIVNCRVYSAPHPSYLTYTDGNHKMICWQLVIHGGLHGFLKWVMDAFQEGVNEYGQPVYVCSDHVRENIEVWNHMLTIWDDPSHIIIGSSTHNELEERINKSLADFEDRWNRHPLSTERNLSLLKA